MTRFVKTSLLGVTLATALPTATVAQEQVEATVGADLVSGYIWRGQDLGGVSLQPSLTLAYKGVSLTAWGSVGLESNDTKEFDLTLGYTTGGLSLSLTDYFFNGGPGYLHYGAHNTNHTFEAQLGYDFGPVALNWYTNLLGTDGVKENGKRAYSSYFTATAPFQLGGLEWEAEVGVTPWETDFYNEGTSGFCVSHVSLKATKEIPLTSNFSLPLFAQVIVNPRTEGSWFVFGMSF